MDLPPISLREKLCLWAIASLLVLAITLPYFLLAARTPPGFRFTWLITLASDQNVYLSWARQAQEGNFFIRDLYTTELVGSSHPVLFHQTLSFLMGILLRLSGMPPVAAMHLVRVVFATAAVFWFHALCREIIPNSRTRLLAVSLLAFSGGIGWLLQAVLHRPGFDTIDGDMKVEGFAFFCAFGMHFSIAAMALICRGLAWVFQAERTGRNVLYFPAGAMILLQGNTHPYINLPLLAACAMMVISKWTMPLIKREPAITLRPYLITAAWALVPVAIFYLTLCFSPDLQLKAHYLVPPPPLSRFVLTYGALGPLAVAGIWLGRDNLRLLFIACWFAAVCIAIYIPFAWSGKLIEGFSLPLCLLAAVGLEKLCAKLPQAASAAVAVAFVLLMSVSSFRFIAWSMQDARRTRVDTPDFIESPSYLSKGDTAALDFLWEHKTPGTKPVVLALPLLANYIPPRTGDYTYVGNWSETVNYIKKLDEVTAFFFTSQSPQKEFSWLHQHRISYVVEGLYEKLLSKRTKVPLPSQRLRLLKVYDQQGTAIYQVPSHID